MASFESQVNYNRSLFNYETNISSLKFLLVNSKHPICANKIYSGKIHKLAQVIRSRGLPS